MSRNGKKRIERAEMKDWQGFQAMRLFQTVSANFNKWLEKMIRNQQVSGSSPLAGSQWNE
jgi:hypothetical protein